MDTTLVTGGAGFIGSHLVNEISGKSRVIVVDNLSMGDKENINISDNVTFIEGDVSDILFLKKIFKTYTFDYIFHLAAVASVAESIENPLETHIVNQDATLLLLNQALKQKKDLKRFVFVSSAAVYGNSDQYSQEENDKVQPLSPYAIDKYASEKFTLLYNQLYGLKTTAVRFFNVYGAKQNPTSPYSGVLSIITDGIKLIKKNEDFKFKKYGSGNQTRDFVYIKDVIQGLLLVSKEEKALGEVYNIGSGMNRSLNEVLKIYEVASNLKIPIKLEDKREGEVKHSLANITKIKKIGYKPNYSLENGVEEYLNN